MSELKISKKQRNLLLNSAVTQEFPWLFQLLKKNTKLIASDVGDEYHSDFINVAPFIIKQAGEEWKGNEDLLYPVEDLGDKRIRCALCGTPNRLIHYIKNKVNGITLNVGSDCINEFVDFEGLQYGKTRSQLVSEARKVKRMGDVNKHFNGIDNIIETWERKLDSYDILIPNSIRIPYLQLRDQIKEKYEGFLNLKYNDSTFEVIGKMFKRYHGFVEEMNQFETTHKNSKFVATKNIIRWLDRNKKDTVIKQLKETGYIDFSTIEFIHEKSFIKRIEPEIVSMLQTLELDVEDINYDAEEFIMSLNVYAGGIWISCPFKKIVDYFGHLLLDSKPKAVLNMKNLLKISNIYSNNSKEIVLELVNDRFQYFERKLSFRIHDESHIRDEVDIVDIEKNRVLVYKLSIFIDEVKKYAIEDYEEAKVIKDEEYYLGIEGKRYTIQELNEIRGLGNAI
ncbi:hypothetical protein SAMN04487895_101648 [Paenibacillus sophorae]|uniref:Uncharacterized protein n=1 Tax=Paenibacillus sophorae TaxID=1333845 RepID=A0A1H8GUE4_9BACL|nr:hypothetical protein [Paenibacillus sophorae]QWU14345.1 hypothetical protein KP014_20785 [Paenibacillus sophorae]SEN47576.1 hypothetical protein SAMN04487895_101648 [Paenibacillus sophorae]